MTRSPPCFLFAHCCTIPTDNVHSTKQSFWITTATSQHNCDDSFLDLVKGFQQLYGIDDLSTLHQYLPSFERYKPVNDSSTLAHKIFYSNYLISFHPPTIVFLCVRQLLDESFYYQSIPCVRFGFPDARGSHHFIRILTTTNFSRRLTLILRLRSYGTCALQIETSPGSGQYVPLTGRVLYFYKSYRVSSRFSC